MKKTLLKCVSVGWALCCAPALMAQTQTPLHLPAIFSDGMVLQQQSSVPVWGWGEASTMVKIVGSWMPEDTVTVQVDDCGRWKTEIPTTRYGGPYTLHIFSNNMPGRSGLRKTASRIRITKSHRPIIRQFAISA